MGKYKLTEYKYFENLVKFKFDAGRHVKRVDKIEKNKSKKY